MEKQRAAHDPAYKQIFSNPQMVESLLRDFIPDDFVADLDFSTLERCSGSYVTDDLRERHDDIVWRVGWKKDSWCYVALLLEFQSTPDHWMTLRIQCYASLLLLELVKAGKVSKNEGLPAVFPIVLYNGGNAWKAPQDIEDLFEPTSERLKRYRAGHRYFLLDGSRVPIDELEKSRGLVAQLLRMERTQAPEQLGKIIKELENQLQGPEYQHLRRAFAIWLFRVVLNRSGMSEESSEVHDLSEVSAMLEENIEQWKNNLIQQGRAEGRAEGKAEGKALGIGIALQDYLELRFGKLPLNVKTYITESSDSNTLRDLMSVAYRVENLQSIIDQIEENKSKTK